MAGERRYGQERSKPVKHGQERTRVLRPTKARHSLVPQGLATKAVEHLLGSYQLRVGDCNRCGANPEIKGLGGMAKYNHRHGFRITRAPDIVASRTEGKTMPVFTAVGALAPTHALL